MIGLAIVVLVVAALVVFCAKWGYCEEGNLGGLFAATVSLLIGIFFIGVPLGAFLIPATGGIGPVGCGVSTGYVVDLNYGGLIWKTWDGTILLGTGEQTAVDEPAKFSVANEWLASKIRGLVGQRARVRLEYDEWIVSPFWVGSNCRVVRWVEVLPDVKAEAEETSG